MHTDNQLAKCCTASPVISRCCSLSEVHVVLPHPLNYPCLRGVAAKAGSVHLMFSMIWKPSRKEGARPRPKQHHTVPQGPPFSIKRLLATGSPQSISIKTHSFLKAKAHTNTSRPFCHTAHTRALLISCVGGVTTRHRNHIHLKPSSASVQPYGPLDRTGVQCLIN